MNACPYSCLWVTERTCSFAAHQACEQFKYHINYVHVLRCSQSLNTLNTVINVHTIGYCWQQNRFALCLKRLFSVESDRIGYFPLCLIHFKIFIIYMCIYVFAIIRFVYTIGLLDVWHFIKYVVCEIHLCPDVRNVQIRCSLGLLFQCLFSEFLSVFTRLHEYITNIVAIRILNRVLIAILFYHWLSLTMLYLIKE